MNLRLATMDDLPQLKAVYEKIIAHMNKNKIQIWDDIYPCNFFENDIEKKRFYVLVEKNEIVSTFALCDSNPGADYVKWKKECNQALYIERFGVNVNYLRRGIGSLTLKKAILLAREKGAKCLRLFVADINKPAINLYLKNGFKMADGIYEEEIDDDFVLHEVGLEIGIIM